MILPLLLALSVTASDAICAVRGWTRQGGTLTVIGAPVKADRFETSAGNAFYAVATSQGTVFVSADTDYEPILAFTSSVADFSQIDPASPLWALMTSSADNAVYDPDAFAKWQELLAAGSLRRVLLGVSQGVTSIGDIRVEPLTKSTWNQSYNNYSDRCYNYYTPNNYTYCGCVATAMAQIMYYHKYPANVDDFERECYVGSAETPTNCTITAGAYDWDAMMDDPSQCRDEKTLEAIGKLTYDAGVGVHMWWKGAGGFTDNCYVSQAFNDIFGYASATYFDSYNGTNTYYGGSAMLATNNLKKVVFSNLDSKYPVMMGITGHSVVVDGYGYDADGQEFVHINMGWGGQDNLWYHLPDFTAPQTGYSFNDVYSFVYNIIPGDEIKATFSGRVTDSGGQAVAGFPVRLATSSNVAVTNAITNAHGVYGVAAKTFSWHKLIADECLDYLAATNTSCRLVLPEVQLIYYGGFPVKRVVLQSARSGNSWGNDLTLSVNNKATPSVSVSVAGSTTPVSIPLSWFVDAGIATSTTGTSTLTSLSQTTAANGINSVAECWVIGISPTNENEKFTASISFDSEGNPQIDYDPNLGSERTYRKLCSDDLKSWREWNGEESANFFKVEVSK